MYIDGAFLINLAVALWGMPNPPFKKPSNQAEMDVNKKQNKFDDLKFLFLFMFF